MDKRVGLGLAAVVLALAAGFGAGWLARGAGRPASAGQPGQASQPARPAGWQPGPEDVAEFWQYPNAEGAGFTQGGLSQECKTCCPSGIGPISNSYAIR